MLLMLNDTNVDSEFPISVQWNLVWYFQHLLIGVFGSCGVFLLFSEEMTDAMYARSAEMQHVILQFIDHCQASFIQQTPSCI